MQRKLICCVKRSLVFVMVGVLLALAGAATAFAQPVLRITSLAASTAAPGDTLQYRLNFSNLGDTNAEGNSEHPLVVTATLPPGLTGKRVILRQAPAELVPVPASASGWECTAGDGVSPVEGASTIGCVNTSGEIEAHSFSPRGLVVEVAVDPGASGVLTSAFVLEGGGASNVSTTVDPTRITSVLPGFGLDAFDGQVSDAAGSVFAQAGGHPYEASASFDLNTRVNLAPMKRGVWPVEPAKDVLVDLPAGLVGDPAGVARCTASELANADNNHNAAPLCPPGSQVGTTLIRVNALGLLSDAKGPLPVFNMVPPPGVPAQFGFNIFGSVVTLDARVRGASDYGISVDARNVSEGLDFAGTTVTFWGVPADPAHDAERACPGQLPPLEGGASCTSGAPLTALLRNPTSCTAPGEGLPFTAHLDSWSDPARFNADGSPDLSDPAWQSGSFRTHQPPGYPVALGEWGAQQGIAGCEQVPFTPSFEVLPTSHTADSPSGLSVALAVPQEALAQPSAIAQADLKSVVFTLPEGVVVNPSAANGLQACSSAQIQLHSALPAGCPDASRIGTAELVVPALTDPLQGSVFLAAQGDNPFGSLLAVYLVAEGQGVVVKLAGHLEADPVTGRLTTVLQNMPQQPVSSVKVDLSGGSRAPLTSPAVCGSSRVESTLEGWNGKTASLTNPYSVDCTPGLGGFAPAFVAGTVNPQAAAFSPFTLTFSRQDGEQNLAGLTVKTPPGLLGVLKSVAQCPEPQAAQGACGEGSLIGHVTAAAGAGPDPFYAPGRVFLTGPYRGSPFGLSVVIPAKAGPFDLGTVVVRSRIDVDPHTSQITIASDPFPTILQGIPLQIRTVNVTVDRPGFIFNPTNCEPLSVGGTIASAEGASAQVSSHFQAANCAALGFHPVFSISTQARTSKKNGASLTVRTRFPGGAQANIRSVAVILPKQLPARLTTIQQACPEATFAQNPAGCPAGSVIGAGSVTTPILASPLVGPAYLVSHGGAAFPDVVIVFQAEGVTFDLVGGVNIKHGITSSDFASVPDAPISSFQLTLPEGPHSGLASNLPAKAKGSMCGQSLVMPTTLTGQNGAQIKQSTKISVTGCPKAKKKAKHKKAKGKKGK